MADSTPAKKLGIKPNQRVVILNAPPGYIEKLGAMPQNVTVSDRATDVADCVLLFAHDQSELALHIGAAISAVKSNGLLWIAYLKKSAKIKTDISRDQGWDVVSAAGWGGVSLIAIDEVWSAMRFRAGAR